MAINALEVTVKTQHLCEKQDTAGVLEAKTLCLGT